MIDNSRGAFACLSHFVDSDPRFLSILTRFVDYYSPFWGPGVISLINEPRGAFTCRSSTLTVFVDSDPFRGLLVTVLVSQSDFYACLTPRCA